MSWFDTPDVPSATDTARAQTSTNVSTAVANAFLNNYNQVTPQGSLNYDQTGSFSWTDPTTNASYTIPRFTSTQTYSPSQQAIFDQTQRTQGNLAGMAADQSASIRNLLSQRVDLSGAPRAGDPGLLGQTPQAVSTYGNVGNLQRSLGNAGNITRSYGANDFSADRRRVEESLYERMSPQLERDRQRMAATLSEQGVRPGDPAYSAAMDQFNRQLTDTRLGITQTAGQEQQRMADMAAQRAGFENAAQQQAFTQQLQGGQFVNQAQQAAYQQEALRAQFRNSAATQNMMRAQAQINAANTARTQYQTEQYAERNQPINEISALLSGSQVSAPNWINTAANQISTTDIAGLINNQFSQNLSNYQLQSNNFNNLMSGIFGAIGGIARSDRRVKENIDKVGTVFAAGPDGEKPLPVYEYSFKDDPASARHVGPMAQDVEKIDRGAVKTIKGTKYIDRTRLGSILKVA